MTGQQVDWFIRSHRIGHIESIDNYIIGSCSLEELLEIVKLLWCGLDENVVLDQHLLVEHLLQLPELICLQCDLIEVCSATATRLIPTDAGHVHLDSSHLLQVPL